MSKIRALGGSSFAVEIILYGHANHKRTKHNEVDKTAQL